MKYLFPLLTLSLLASCASDTRLKNADGSDFEFAEIKIGRKIWMDRNLNVDRFRNGDSIPEARTPEEWSEAWRASKPAWCYFENDARYGPIMGRLYNVFAMSDQRGLAPEGWHVADGYDWKDLALSYPYIENARHFKSQNGWANGDNQSGFNAVMSGYRGAYRAFRGLKAGGYWWVGLPIDKPVHGMTKQYMITLRDDQEFVGKEQIYSEGGYSIRCVKDSI